MILIEKYSKTEKKGDFVSLQKSHIYIPQELKELLSFQYALGLHDGSLYICHSPKGFKINHNSLTGISAKVRRFIEQYNLIGKYNIDYENPLLIEGTTYYKLIKK